MLQNAQRAERVVIATAYGSADNAVEALKAGAYDYLSKPIDLKQLRLVVRSAISSAAEPASNAMASALKAASAEAVRAAPHEPSSVGGVGGAGGAALERLVGASPSMVRLRGMVLKVAASMAPVMIAGESGTGKELIARAVHQVSARGAAPFMPVNCGAIPSELLEAEFFGYRKGSFTGASTDRDGFFQAAAGGTLFLDEVAELPLAMQAKLLRALQERRVRRVGDTAETPVDVRIVSATHQDLGKRVAEGLFRQDLYYRLNVIELPVPPLRDRAGDINLLAGHMLTRLGQEDSRSFVLADDALAALQSYSYPGNVRELENILQRACALATDDLLHARDLAFNTVQAGAAGSNSSGAQDRPDFLPSDIGVYIDGVEREVLERALEKTRYNRTEAASMLGLTLRQIRYRMARLGIKDDD